MLLSTSLPCSRQHVQVTDMQTDKQVTRAGPLEEEGNLGCLRAYRKNRVKGEL